jgi:DNA-binding GntR family transcriptional regulator
MMDYAMALKKGRLVGVMNARNRPKVKTAEDAYEHLFDAIVDQRLLPGTKLTELALMETFGVSRRTIGVALQRLVWENLVVTFPNRGAYIAAPEAPEVREIFAARIAIEAGTTEAVARAADPRAIAKLTDNLAQERALRQEGRMREAIHLSGGFHLLMANLSGNRILAEQVRLLVARTSLVINLFENQSGLAGWHDHHGDLIRLCESGRVDAAVALKRDHIQELENSIALDRRRPVSFDMLGVFGTLSD